jgi:hypothetical protein
MIANLKEREILFGALDKMYEHGKKLKAKDVVPGTLVIAKFVEELDPETYIDHVLLIVYRIGKDKVRAGHPGEDKFHMDDQYVLELDQEVVELIAIGETYGQPEHSINN